MAIQINELELVPAVETIGIRSKYSGTDPHVAVMEYRPSGGSWRRGIPLTLDNRPTVQYSPSSSQITNPYAYEWRGVIFKTQLDTAYDVRVTYYDLSGNNLGYHEDTVRTRNNNPPIGTNYLVVSLDGNDAGSGSEADPLRTIQHALDISNPGSTILLRGGVRIGEQLVIGRSGALGNHITMMPFRGEPVVIDGLGLSSHLLLINLASYIRIKGLHLRNAYLNLIHLYGGNENPNLARGGWEIIIEDCLLENANQGNTSAGNGMVRLQHGSGRNLIFQRNRLVQSSGGGVYGIYLWRPGANVAVGDNVFTSPNGLLSDCIGGGPENDITYTHEYDVYRNAVDGHTDDGYQIEGACRNLRIWENTVRGGLIGVALCPALIGPAYVVRNVLFGYISRGYKLGDASYGHIYSYHNTIVGGTGYGQTNDGLGNFFSRNNIIDASWYIVEHYKLPLLPCDVDHDLMFSTRVGPWYKWDNITYNSLAAFTAATGQEAHGIWGQGSFFNKASGDLRLLPGSLGIDQGVILPGFNDADSPWPYVGDAPDIGAIESSGEAPPPTADFTAAPVQGPAPLTVSFTNRSTGAIDSVLWDFGDGATSSEVNPTHVYAPPGDYTVTLTVTGPGGSNSAAIQITVTAPVISHVLTIEQSTGGIISPSPGQYPYPEGQTVEITAIPDAGYAFIEWQEAGVGIGTANAISILMDADRTITAVFEAVVIPPTDYSVTISVIGSGTTSPAPEAYTVAQGASMTIEAIPAEGWKFDHWEGDATGSLNPLVIQVNSNLSIVAVFVKKEPAGFFELLWDIAPFFPWEGPPFPRFTGWDWNHLPTLGGAA